MEHRYVAEKFWKESNNYPKYHPSGMLKRRLCEINYIIPKLVGNSILDLGCGDGTLLNCLLQLTDIAKYYAYDYSENLLSNLHPEIETKIFNCYTDDLSSLPDVDITITSGMFQYIFEDEKVSEILRNIKSPSLFLRIPCTTKRESEYINTYSEALNSRYASVYRTVTGVLDLLSEEYVIESVDRIWPDDIESTFDTKQYYFVAKRIT